MSERVAPISRHEEQDRKQEATDDRRADADGDAEPVTTGAEAVVRALENAGVEYAFGVQGGAIMPVYDALYDSDIYHVTMAHEQGAAHAADAYGIVSGEPGLCLATSGPGATNLVTGIADADMDSDPMLALTGQVPTNFVGNDAFQETDTTGVTAPITKNNTFSTDADRVGTDVSEAFALARDGRPGPTLVDLPKDVTKGETDREPVEPTTPETYEVQEEADSEIVEAAARRIENAERPVMLLGGGVIKGDASEQCRAFAIEHEIPVITTMPGLGAFPEDHELSLEMAGMHGTGYANMAISMCDTLIGVGTRFDDRLTGGIETFAPDAELIHVDIDPAEISKNIHAEYPLVGDAATVIEQLDEAVESSPEATKWRAQCQQWKSEYPMEYEAPEDDPVKPQFVVEALDEATGDDAIVTTGVGQHQMWACQYWTYTEPRTWVSSHGLGAMGYGVPAAIGARLAADDDQDVICVDGDGSFLMTMQELSVAVRENMDITFVVLNNEYIGMVRQWQDAFFEGRHAASDYGWMPEFDKLAEAFGAEGYRIDDYDEVADTIEAALAYDGPAVIDAHIDPRENVYPMVPSGGDNAQFALTEEQL
ncbi:biosynthetic-type acetolactate synthase large subunit [Natrialbaceae archaeon AArc-T1-2]|uniref:biosynthetic-type acetolactate synthase large subunit n=1 Tax=Natrialbaceae archaeon AArc-T1-2 TaxID=3053904 RepID=UPI00255AA5FF|nr:biosynthetic-type acetolactate synthase large subunit [Natrialbaceae archaeon AArc-T1-2]WIV67216.1 biosynthetic-type acetolactate synthase large subunit [Natrialbaceae archaeon AArc-T1-2]